MNPATTGVPQWLRNTVAQAATLLGFAIIIILARPRTAWDWIVTIAAMVAAIGYFEYRQDQRAKDRLSQEDH